MIVIPALIAQAGSLDASTHANPQPVAESRRSGKPLVSVVIPTKNRSKQLKEAIESVLNVQHEAFDLEVIVIDDGATDDTPTLVKQYPVRYLRTEGIGVARVRSMGIHEASGDFITFLDDDDLWMPNNITPHLEMFARHPEYGAVHAQAQLTDYDKVPFGKPIPNGPFTSGWILEDMLNYFPQVGTVLVRIEVARAVGDMDSTLTGDHEWDWFLRIAGRYQFGRIEQPVMLFRQRDHAVEELSWRRFPAMDRIFYRHTRPLGLLKRLRLQPILFRHRGAWAVGFLRAARTNYVNGERKRAYRSLYYAFRCSPIHTVYNFLRYWPLYAPKSAKKQSVS